MPRLSKRTVIYLAAIVVLAVLISVLFVRHRHRAQPRAETTSKSATAQSGYTGGTGHTPNPSGDTNQGGAKDNHGDSSGTENETGTSSASGVVTVIAPNADSVVSTGVVLRGRANGVTAVQYRLIDDDVGVIAQGSLDVVDSTYSGSLQFKPHAKTGRLDVFTYDGQYKEVNEVQLTVRLGD